MKKIAKILTLLAAGLLLFGCAGPSANAEGTDEEELTAEEAATTECPEGTVAVEDAEDDAPLAERCIAEADTEAGEVGTVTSDPDPAAASTTSSPSATDGAVEPGPSTPDDPVEGGDPVPPKGPQD